MVFNLCIKPVLLILLCSVKFNTGDILSGAVEQAVGVPKIVEAPEAKEVPEEMRCEKDCFDYHRLCQALNNASYLEMASAKIEYINGKYKSREQIPLPDCKNEFYLDRCPRSCSKCVPCNYALDSVLNSEVDELNNKLVEEMLNMKTEYTKRIESLQKQVDIMFEDLSVVIDFQESCKGSGGCLNGGTCNKDAVCECTPQWTGEFCDTDVDECKNNPCKGAPSICQNKQGSYECVCGEGYTWSDTGYCRGTRKELQEVIPYKPAEGYDPKRVDKYQTVEYNQPEDHDSTGVRDVNVPELIDYYLKFEDPVPDQPMFKRQESGTTSLTRLTKLTVYRASEDYHLLGLAEEHFNREANKIKESAGDACLVTEADLQKITKVVVKYDLEKEKVYMYFQAKEDGTLCGEDSVVDSGMKSKVFDAPEGYALAGFTWRENFLKNNGIVAIGPIWSKKTEWSM